MSKISVTAIVALSLATGLAATVQAEPPYQPFPAGYGYMEPREIAALKAAVKAGDHKVVREHGWRLWAGIMQPDAAGTGPIWFTWPNTKAAFAPSAGLTAEKATGKSLILLNAVRAGQPTGGVIPVNIPQDQLPYYPIPQYTSDHYPNATKNCAPPANNICDGAHFLFNGDIMIPTESLSREGFDWIRGKRLYEQSSSTSCTAGASRT